MKKWTVVIMIFITSAGTFFPCCLIDDCCAEQETSSHNGNQQSEKGTCSPFSACTACAGFVEIAKPIQLAEPDFQKPMHEEIDFSFILSNYFHSFWQPPKIG